MNIALVIGGTAIAGAFIFLLSNLNKANVTIFMCSPGITFMLSEYAKKYTITVLMSNYCGKVWGLNAGGNSAGWDHNGNLVAALNDNDKGLVMISKNG